MKILARKSQKCLIGIQSGQIVDNEFKEVEMTEGEIKFYTEKGRMDFKELKVDPEKATPQSKKKVKSSEKIKQKEDN